jgi:hypothetical protein
LKRSRSPTPLGTLAGLAVGIDQGCVVERQQAILEGDDGALLEGAVEAGGMAGQLKIQRQQRALEFVAGAGRGLGDDLVGALEGRAPIRRDQPGRSGHAGQRQDARGGPDDGAGAPHPIERRCPCLAPACDSRRPRIAALDPAASAAAPWPRRSGGAGVRRPAWPGLPSLQAGTPMLQAIRSCVSHSDSFQTSRSTRGDSRLRSSRWSAGNVFQAAPLAANIDRPRLMAIGWMCVLTYGRPMMLPDIVPVTRQPISSRFRNGTMSSKPEVTALPPSASIQSACAGPHLRTRRPATLFSPASGFFQNGTWAG